MTTLTKDAVAPLGVKPRDAERSKNFFALGLISWMYTRPSEPTLVWIEEKFASKPQVAAANRAAFAAGHAFGETAELFEHPYSVRPAEHAPGTYTNITGNTALAWGLVAAGQLAKLPVFLGGYPITPASDILHELSKHKNFGIRTMQAEDEIAGIGAALGAAFGGHLAVTTTSGPGIALKSETMGLAISLELPLLVIDIQRGGPSTGLPTKTEQSDLLQAMYGRHGESPIPIVAAYTPAQCFDAAIEAARIALKYRTPVMLLSDGYLANGSEPWLLPRVEDLPDISVAFATEANHLDADGQPEFWPYLRDPETLARPWAVPGTPGLEHRIGGIEKADGSGNISYDPANHEHMVHLRAAKVAGIAQDIPPVALNGDVDDAELLVVGWGSTWGGHRRRPQPVSGQGPQGGPRPPHPPEPVPRQPGRGPAPPSPRGGARDEPRPALEAAARRVPRRRQGRHQGPGRPVHRRRARDRLPEGAGRMTDVATPTTTPQDWASDQEVRWCPGCGDYSILKAVQALMPTLGGTTENTVFVSGIGCAARFPYYMDTYGMHSIHGRAPAIATGLALARPDLDVWVVGGDGDMLSIGGNHLIHALRRNVDLTILMFNNQIYGLTKGQYSPTSEVGKVTKSTPFGSLDQPFNPMSVALGAEASFVARTHDLDRKHMVETFRRAREHRGASFVEVFQNCNVFNDGAFGAITGKGVRDDMLIPLVHGQPIRFGAEQDKGVVVDERGRAQIAVVADVGEAALLVHDEAAAEPGLAFELSRLSTGPYEPTPIGVFRAVERPDYGSETDRQLLAAQDKSGPGDLTALLHSRPTWDVP
nr:thiamine pyrophosphate-dependent enzyme [Aquihabitans sp. G128]